MTAIKATRTWSIVLFIDSSNKEELKNLPAELKTKVSNLPGTYIPKLLITSADMTQEFGSFS
ncbi:hypothetical protein [Rubritalea sp.]|uniref:hypothetical protein n=1 Tax=Rubritalea sp. TaxID=2109375 RepID=UPI003EF69DB9